MIGKEDIEHVRKRMGAKLRSLVRDYKGKINSINCTTERFK